MRGDYLELSTNLQKRHDKQTITLSKITKTLLDKKDTDGIREYLKRVMMAELFALRITRPLFVAKIKFLANYLKVERNIDIKQQLK
jgi:hypothetical protein|tara:strand:+ start:734 stop:991 length:258 start_codon:yes stop_codon:yes gene_type:complete